MYYLLIYDYVENMAERRQPYRDAHLALVGQARERGELPMSAAFADPLDGAALMFDVDDSAKVEQFARNDPYVRNGLVPRWRVRRWPVTWPASR